MEREACVCDHGFERSDLCAEIIIIIIIIIVSFKNAGYANACGWESKRTRGNTKYGRLIDNAPRDFEKINHISSLQSLHAVTDACYS